MDSCQLLIKKFILIITNIVNDVILDTPFDEIQLRQSRLYFMRCSRNDIGKLLRPTEWVKKLFTVTIQTRFIGTMNCKQFTITRLICDVILFRIVRDEPFQITERDTTRFIQNVQ
jgi:hypothetical protein